MRNKSGIKIDLGVLMLISVGFFLACVLEHEVIGW